jgi:HrpA-like RNA helicase
MERKRRLDWDTNDEVTSSSDKKTKSFSASSSTMDNNSNTASNTSLSSSSSTSSAWDHTSKINHLNGKEFSKRYHDILTARKKLPVWQFLDQLEKYVKENQVIIVEGETGSGKTTQVSISQPVQNREIFTNSAIIGNYR